MPDPQLLMFFAALAGLGAALPIWWALRNEKRTGEHSWGLWNTGMTLVTVAILLVVAAEATPR